MASVLDSVRMDKWLWAARFFKTRSEAARACELGRVWSNDHQAKAARDVRLGDKLRVKTEGGEYAIEVLGLSAMRGPAAVAQTLYAEREESRSARALAAEARKLAAMDFDGGRPTKKDRRDLRKTKGRIIRFGS